MWCSTAVDKDVSRFKSFPDLLFTWHLKLLSTPGRDYLRWALFLFRYYLLFAALWYDRALIRTQGPLNRPLTNHAFVRRTIIVVGFVDTWQRWQTNNSSFYCHSDSKSASKPLRHLRYIFKCFIVINWRRTRWDFTLLGRRPQ